MLAADCCAIFSCSGKQGNQSRVGMQEEASESVANGKQFSRKWARTRFQKSILWGRREGLPEACGTSLTFPQLCGYECNTSHVHLHRHRRQRAHSSAAQTYQIYDKMGESYHGQRLVHGQELGFYSKCFMKPLSDLSRERHNSNYIFKGQKVLNRILANPIS